MRFFKGDGPAAQFEAGQQKGGNYVCWVCDINAVEHSNYSYSLHRVCIDLQYLQEKVLFTEQSRRKSHDKVKKLYTHLKKKEIIELNQHNIKFTENESKQYLDLKLATTMSGIQRVPSLIFHQPDISLPETGISKYELLMEPLHNVFNHLKNLFAELPHHFDKKTKREIERIIELTFKGKDVKRAIDYRSCIIKTAIYCQQKFPQNPLTDIFITMCQIQELIYKPESDRTNELILKMYVVVFKHVMLVMSNHGENLNVLTVRKFYGKYFHCLVTYTPDQLRIISGRAANTEKEERQFNFIKTTTNTTSNLHPSHIISNALIRMQVFNEFNSNFSKIPLIESSISMLYKVVQPKSNTTISFETIKNYPNEYRAMLQKIADFHIEPNVYWCETKFGVEFYDFKNMTTSKKTPDHFRTKTIIEELNYIKSCWNEICLPNANILIPAYKIKVKDKITTKAKLIFSKTLKNCSL
ncbi:uncharacterized protein LOC136076144 [Hydra vulgaris]|uniref:Uncharacterized protein LOC136076144 n=1 Tax=Hydra vulgaris TaxID=6087 RepID=A0ABM4B9W7_HYDVU